MKENRAEIFLSGGMTKGLFESSADPCMASLDLFLVLGCF